MINRILYVNSDEINQMNFSEKIFLVEIDGKKIMTEKDLILDIAEKFHFPAFSYKNNEYIMWYENLFKKFDCRLYKLPSWDVCEDWLTDLAWIEQEQINIVIYRFSFFLKHDREFRDFFIHRLETVILPWWEKDVMNCMIDGKTKEMTVYLTD